LVRKGGLEPASELRAPAAAQPWRARTLTVLAATGLTFAGTGVTNPVLPSYAASVLHARPGEVGLIVGWYALATLIVRPFCGFWVDRSGHRMIFAAGSAVMAVTCGLFAIISSANWMLVDRLAVGAGLALMFAAAPLWTVAMAPPDRGQWALGLVGVVTSLTLAVSAPIGGWLYSLGGYRAVAIAAALLPACGLFLVLLVRPSPWAAAGPRPARRSGGWWSEGVKPALLPGISLALTGFGYAAILSFGVIALKSRGVSGGSATLSCYGVAYLVTRLSTQRLAERLGPSATVAASCLIEVAGLVMLAFAPSLPVAVAGAALIGAGSAHMYPAMGVEVLSSARASGGQAAIAVYASFIQFSIAAGGPVLGVIVGWAGYQVMFLASGALAVIGVTASLIRYGGWRPSAQRALGPKSRFSASPPAPISVRTGDG
jgi:predicted MFS family arabinose efflux permease